MKRIHIHIAVNNIENNIGFYSALFNAQPSVQQPDYAKWALDEPAVNFSISNRSSNHRVDHLGIQVDSDEELSAIDTRMRNRDIHTDAQTNAQCCYAKSNKSWVEDPQGVNWELFHTFGAADTFGESRLMSEAESNGACCVPNQTAEEGAAQRCC